MDEDEALLDVDDDVVEVVAVDRQEARHGHVLLRRCAVGIPLHEFLLGCGWRCSARRDRGEREAQQETQCVQKRFSLHCYSFACLFFYRLRSRKEREIPKKHKNNCSAFWLPLNGLAICKQQSLCSNFLRNY